jgi:hypothetical protein
MNNLRQHLELCFTTCATTASCNQIGSCEDCLCEQCVFNCEQLPLTEFELEKVGEFLEELGL